MDSRIKVDDKGAGLTSDVIDALDWVLENQKKYDIRVVNLSLGHPVYESANEDPLVLAVEALWDAGIVVVCSAGNSGELGYGSITSPGNSSKVITVGSITHWGDKDPSNDMVSSFSSMGPTRGDHFVKPDLLAPGNRVNATKSRRSFLSNKHKEKRIGKHYFQLSGTSMSAAVVTGTVALMLEKDPSLTPDTIKARLMRSATKPGVADVFATGAGVLNIEAALEENGVDD